MLVSQKWKRHAHGSCCTQQCFESILKYLSGTFNSFQRDFYSIHTSACTNKGTTVLVVLVCVLFRPIGTKLGDQNEGSRGANYTHMKSARQFTVDVDSH